MVDRQAGGGITSGASAPEDLVKRLVEYFRARGTSHVRELQVSRRTWVYAPREVRQAMAGAG